MIDGNDMWNCIKWIAGIGFVFVLVIGMVIGGIVGVASSGRSTATTSKNEIVGKLEAGSPKHSIPTNTMIVAACTDDCGVFAYIVKDTNGNHYYVGLVSRVVRKIEEVNVEKSFCEQNKEK